MKCVPNCKYITKNNNCLIFGTQCSKDLPCKQEILDFYRELEKEFEVLELCCEDCWEFGFGGMDINMKGHIKKVGESILRMFKKQIMDFNEQTFGGEQ